MTVETTDDIPYKIAMAAICAERKVPELIPSLCVSVEQCGDAAFLRLALKLEIG